MELLRSKFREKMCSQSMLGHINSFQIYNLKAPFLKENQYRFRKINNSSKKDTTDVMILEV